jgi:hypothetical protein
MPATYEPIATTTLGSAQATVTFSSIPSTYTDLVLVTIATTSVGGRDYNLRFNSDTGSNYSFTVLAGSGSAASSTRASNTSSTGLYTVAGTSTSTPGVVISQILNYSNTTTYKTIIQRGNEPAGEVCAGVSLWRSTSAISTIAITASTGSGNWNSGSTFTLYGIKAA